MKEKKEGKREVRKEGKRSQGSGREEKMKSGVTAHGAREKRGTLTYRW